MRGQVSLGVILGALLLMSALSPLSKLENVLMDAARRDVGTVICQMYARHYALLLSEANRVGGYVNMETPPWVGVSVDGNEVRVWVDAMDLRVDCSEGIP